MPSYFRQVPNFEYVNRTADAQNISDYDVVKNIFKRGKLRQDIFGDLSFFTKYKIIGDNRPDNVAYEIYGDSTLDWLVLLSNNIINIQTEWPLSQQSHYNFLIDKYTSEENLNSIHHYETIEVKNSAGVTIIPSGLYVQPDFSTTFYDLQLQSTVTKTNITFPVTNYEYEIKIEEDKRNIFLLQPKFINVILNDMNDLMQYKKGSTQYVSETLKKADNIRLYS
jgi:hypothetical protein